MIIFVKNRQGGASTELGDNLAKEINKKFPAMSVFKENIDLNVKNSIIIFVKYIDRNLALKLKENNNKIYYFVVDRYPVAFLDIDLSGVIYSSLKQQQDFSKFFNTKNSHVYYHHYSPFYNKISPKTKDIGYFVAPQNVSPALKDIKGIDIHTDFDAYKDFMSEYKFHIEYREKQSINFLYKPCVKLSTAVFCESVFVCSKDNSYLELLPKDYPYLLDKINQDIIEDIKSSYYDIKYKYALEIIMDLKTKLNISSTSKKFLIFLSKKYL